MKHQSLEWERDCRGSGSNARPPVRELARWTTRPHRRPGLDFLVQNIPIISKEKQSVEADNAFKDLAFRVPFQRESAI